MKTKRLAGTAPLAMLALAGAMMTSSCSNTSLDAQAIEESTASAELRLKIF